MSKITDIHNDILGKQLDLERLMDLPKEKSDLILKLFDDLMDSFLDGNFQIPSGSKMDVTRMVVLYNTLSDEGWLITRREKNLNKLTE